MLTLKSYIKLINSLKKKNYSVKTLFTISFDKKEEHLDLVRKKNSIDEKQDK